MYLCGRRITYGYFGRSVRCAVCCNMSSFPDCGKCVYSPFYSVLSPGLLARACSVRNWMSLIVVRMCVYEVSLGQSVVLSGSVLV